MVEQRPGLRIDKWLWHARFFKTRSLAAKAVAGGIRIGETRVTKPSVIVRIGDTVTFPQSREIRLVQVEGLGERRGPAPEAQALYTDLAPIVPKDRAKELESDRVGGRPTKKDRRDMDTLRNL